MFRLNVVVILLLTMIISCSKENQLYDDLPEKFISQMKEVNSLSYDIDFKMRYIGKSDTNSVSGKCFLIKVPEDTLFGGLIWIDVNDTVSKYYDLNHIYEINHNNKKIIKYDAHNQQDWAISGNISANLIDFDFLNNYTSFFNQISDEKNDILIKDTNLNNRKYYFTEIKHPDNEEITNAKQINLINKNTKTIGNKSTVIYYYDDLQYMYFNKKNIQIDNITHKDLFEQFNSFNKYEMDDYNEKEQEPLIQAGEDAPDITGYFYSDGSKFKLNDYRGQIVLLDFWYMNCYFCIQAIPHLSEIYNKYSDKGVAVLGLNPIDTSESALARFPKLIEKQNMTYPTIFISKEIPQKYKISGYPTFYLLDKQGKIVYSGAGWGDWVAEFLEKEIIKLME